MMESTNKQHNSRPVNYDLLKATKRFRWNLKRRYATLTFGTFEAMSYVK